MFEEGDFGNWVGRKRKRWSMFSEVGKWGVFGEGVKGGWKNVGGDFSKITIRGRFNSGLSNGYGGRGVASIRRRWGRCDLKRGFSRLGELKVWKCNGGGGGKGKSLGEGQCARGDVGDLVKGGWGGAEVDFGSNL